MNDDCVFFLSQDELMYMLRKLLLNIGDLPAQTSHILFNYLVSRRTRVSAQPLFFFFFYALSSKVSDPST